MFDLFTLANGFEEPLWLTPHQCDVSRTEALCRREAALTHAHALCRSPTDYRTLATNDVEYMTNSMAYRFNDGFSKTGWPQLEQITYETAEALLVADKLVAPIGTADGSLKRICPSKLKRLPRGGLQTAANALIRVRVCVSDANVFPYGLALFRPESESRLAAANPLLVDAHCVALRQRKLPRSKMLDTIKEVFPSVLLPKTSPREIRPIANLRQNGTFEKSGMHRHTSVGLLSLPSLGTDESGDYKSESEIEIESSDDSAELSHEWVDAFEVNSCSLTLAIFLKRYAQLRATHELVFIDESSDSEDAYFWIRSDLQLLDLAKRECVRQMGGCPLLSFEIRAKKGIGKPLNSDGDCPDIAHILRSAAPKQAISALMAHVTAELGASALLPFTPSPVDCSDDDKHADVDTADINMFPAL